MPCSDGKSWVFDWLNLIARQYRHLLLNLSPEAVGRGEALTGASKPSIDNLIVCELCCSVLMPVPRDLGPGIRSLLLK